MLLGEATLFGITRVQILEWYAFAHLVSGDNSRAFRQTEQHGFLLVDAGFVGCDVGLEGAHFRRIQGEPQTQLALAACRLDFLQLRNINDGADRVDRAQTLGRVTIESSSVDRYPSSRPVGMADPMYDTPFSFVGSPYRLRDSRAYGGPISFVDEESGLVVGHLCPRGEAENPAEFRRETGHHSLEISLENADVADLDRQRKEHVGRQLSARACSFGRSAALLCKVSPFAASFHTLRPRRWTWKPPDPPRRIGVTQRS